MFLRTLLIPPAALLLFTSQSLFAESNGSVFVEASGEVGQALLITHASSCYAIVPTHVVGGGAFTTLVGRGDTAPMGDALSPKDFGYDISVMPVEGDLSNHCGPSYDTISRNINALLQGDLRAQANTVNPDGTISRIPLTIVDQSLTYVYVKPSYASEHLVKGMSGSLISVRGKTLGMLLAVDSETGAGKVIRLDRTLETIAPYFRSKIGSLTDTARTNLVISTNLPENMLSAVTKWTASPIDADHRALNLISSSADAKPWIAKINKLPTRIIFELKGNESTTIDELYISGTGLENNQALAKSIEVLIDQTGRGKWKSIGTITIPKSGKTERMLFPPMKAKQLMLNIYNNWGSRDEIGLGSVHLAGQ